MKYVVCLVVLLLVSPFGANASKVQPVPAPERPTFTHTSQAVALLDSTVHEMGLNAKVNAGEYLKRSWTYYFVDVELPPASEQPMTRVTRDDSLVVTASALHGLQETTREVLSTTCRRGLRGEAWRWLCLSYRQMIQESTWVLHEVELPVSSLCDSVLVERAIRDASRYPPRPLIQY